MAYKNKRNNRSKTNSVKSPSKAVIVERNLETIEISGTVYFTCQICNRLIKDKKLAVDHSQKCSPLIYSAMKNKIISKLKDNKDPYEIIPEEMDFEDQIINNNNVDLNRNNSERRLPKKLRATEMQFLREQKEKQLLSLKPESTRNHKCVPKKITRNNRQPHDASVLWKNIVDEDLSVMKSKKDSITKSKRKQSINAAKDPRKNSKKSNIMNQKGKRRTTRQLTEKTIEERLKRISEKLKRHKRGEHSNEDEEEEERKAIEERLAALNKDSEIGVKEEDSASINTDDEYVLRDLIENNGEVQYITDLPTSDTKLNNALIKFEENSTLNMQKNGGEIIVITQKPDGQLHACKKCSEVFVTAIDLLRHTRNKHTYPKIMMAPSEIEKLLKCQDRSECPICKKPITPPYKSIYEKHLQTHSWVAEHECSICKKKFKRRDHMKVHEKRHIV